MTQETDSNAVSTICITCVGSNAVGLKNKVLIVKVYDELNIDC